MQYGGQWLGCDFDEFRAWHVLIDGRGWPIWSRISQFGGFFSVFWSILACTHAIILRSGTTTTAAAISLDCAQGVFHGKWRKWCSNHPEEMQTVRRSLLFVAQEPVRVWRDPQLLESSPVVRHIHSLQHHALMAPGGGHYDEEKTTSMCRWVSLVYETNDGDTVELLLMGT